MSCPDDDDGEAMTEVDGDTVTGDGSGVALPEIDPDVDSLAEFVADMIAVTFNMAGDGTDARASQLAECALAAIPGAGYRIVADPDSLLPEGDLRAHHIGWMTDSEIEDAPTYGPEVFPLNKHRGTVTVNGLRELRERPVFVLNHNPEWDVDMIIGGQP